MGGHLDDGEPDQEHPILSFSIGLSCIFLIGVESKEIEPLAIKLDTGDLVIMSGRS
jgi:alkylated DNA repair protein alkB family protein 1